MRSVSVIVASLAVVVAVFVGVGLLGQPATGQQAPPAANWRYQTTSLQGQVYAFVVTDTQTGQVWGYQGGIGWQDLGMPAKEKKR